METFQATAPDLDEIIVGSDEENADLLGSCAQGSESVTMSQLIERFRKIWQNEKLSPELMATQTETVALINREIANFESQAKSLPKGDVRAQLMRMEIERLRYLLTDYLRIRIRKIEQFPHHVIAEERARPQSEDPHLTPAEFNFAKSLNTLTTENLRSIVLDHLPLNMRKTDPDAIAFRPNLDSYVFCQVNSRVEAVDPTSSSDTSSSSFTLMPGEIHLLRYRTIRNYIENGAVTLL